MKDLEGDSYMAVRLDGSLNIDDVVAVAKGGASVELGREVRARVEENRKFLEEAVEKEERPIYGVTTGFGNLVCEEIPEEKRRQLQVNLLRSHSAGVGEPLSRETVRGIMALRANSLGRGYSGVRVKLLESLIGLLNEDVVPYVPKKGSLGASGDLIPLAHAGSVLIGEGKAYYEDDLLPGSEALEEAGLKPVELREKEGLALINGTQAMTAVTTIAAVEVRRLLRVADIIAAMTAYMVGGNFSQYDSRIYELRPYEGQEKVASNMRKLLGYEPDEYRPKNVQDPYSIRCVPQIHGGARSALERTVESLETEINSVTDNPLIFENDTPVISGGNFHGEPIALVADYLGMALTELGNVSERRVNRLLHPDLNGDLPPFLAEDPGTNSGFMLAQYTSAALTSENKNLANPASVDSVPVSGDQEDHVSMGMHSAEQLQKIVENVRKILSVELIAGVQAQETRENELPDPLADVYENVREVVPPVEEDRELSTLIENVSNLLWEEDLFENLPDRYSIE